MKALFFSVFILFFYALCFPQKDTPFSSKYIKDKEKLKIAKDSIKKGDKFYKAKYYKQALIRYLVAEDINPDNSELNLKIGNCYLHSAHKSKAREYLEKAYKLNPKIDKDIFYYLGRSYHYEENWDKALEFYNKWKETSNKYNVDKFIKECEYAKELSKNPVNVKIINLGGNINTQYAEYSPLISADESVIFFTSRRPETTGGKKDYKIDDWMEDIYISKMKDSTWQEAKNLGAPVNSELHDATVGLSADGQILYIYRSENDNGGDIYECKLTGDKWSDPKPLNSNINTKYQEPSASLSPDGRTLYFVSNKPGGIGGKDIYVSHLMENGEWGKAQNIGEPINSKGDEDGVFIHPDGKTLYFSSNGHKTIGGYDIFYSVFENGKWSEVKNLGYPVNTPDDDIFFVIAANGKNAYYSSGKVTGYGEKDIYKITFLEEKKKEPQLTLLKGVITNEEGNVLSAKIKVWDTDGDSLIAEYESNEVTGKYLISLPSGKNYLIKISADNYLPYEENIPVEESEGYNELERNIVLHKKIIAPPEPKIDTTPPPPPPPPKPNIEFTIQIAASHNKSIADKISSKMNKLGLNTYTQYVIFEDVNEHWYRVRIGKFDTYEEASNAAQKLPVEKLPHKRYWIDNVRKDNFKTEKNKYKIQLEE